MRKLSIHGVQPDSTKISIWQEAIVNFDNSTIPKEKAIKAVMTFIRSYDEFQFYQLIGTLLRDIGFNVSVSRGGDTNNRADAFIIDDTCSIPIEIKSPTEIEYINIKSIRQALENKIVLLSRKSFKTTNETSSLSIGYYYPESRSGVAELVEDIYKTYKISIGYIDTYNLLSIHWDKLFSNKQVDLNTIRNLKGAYK